MCFDLPKVVSCDIRQTAVGIAPGLWYIVDPQSAYLGWVAKESPNGLIAVRYGTDDDRRKASRPLLEGTPAT